MSVAMENRKRDGQGRWPTAWLPPTDVLEFPRYTSMDSLWKMNQVIPFVSVHSVAYLNPSACNFLEKGRKMFDIASVKFLQAFASRKLTWFIETVGDPCSERKIDSFSMTNYKQRSWSRFDHQGAFNPSWLLCKEREISWVIPRSCWHLSHTLSVWTGSSAAGRTRDRSSTWFDSLKDASDFIESWSERLRPLVSNRFDPLVDDDLSRSSIRSRLAGFSFIVLREIITVNPFIFSWKCNYMLFYSTTLCQNIHQKLVHQIDITTFTTKWKR